MKLRTLILAAGALLTTGGTAVLGKSETTDIKASDSVYLEEHYPTRYPNGFYLQEEAANDDYYFPREQRRDHPRTMDRYHSEGEDFTQDESGSWRGRTNQREKNYENRHFHHFGRMRRAKDFNFRHGCGFRR